MIRVETEPGCDGEESTRHADAGVSVRRATSADGQALATVALGQMPIAERLARGEQVFLAEVDGKPVGCTFLSRAPVRLDWYRLAYRPRPGEAYHYGLNVLPEARRRGVALALSRAAIRAAGELGARRVVCFVDAVNQAGLAVQGRLGGREWAAWFVLVIANRWGAVLWRRRRRGPVL